MNSFALYSVLLGLFVVSLVTPILQFATLRLVRLASCDQRLDSDSTTEATCSDLGTKAREPSSGVERRASRKDQRLDSDSTTEATCSDLGTKAREPSSRVERRASRKAQLKNPFSEIPTSKEDRPICSTPKPRYPASDPQWQWSSYVNFQSKYGEMDLRKRDEREDSAQTDDGPFKVHYLRRRDIKWPDVVVVSITSPLLVSILQQYLPDNGELKSQAEPKVKGRDLYVLLQSLKCHDSKARANSFGGDHPIDNKLNLAPSWSHRADGEHGTQLGKAATKKPGTDNGVEFGIVYVKHLVRFLEKEYKDELKKEARMREEKQVAWDMLWTFLSKGVKVGYYCNRSEKLLCAIVAASSYSFEPSLRNWVFSVSLDAWDFDGSRYKACTISRKIEMFPDERQFSKLEVCPIEILGDPSDLYDKFLTNGREFYELTMKSSNRFMFYQGPLLDLRRDKGELVRKPSLPREDGWAVYKQKGDGRVMIDLHGFASMNPNFPMGSARPLKPLSRGLCGIRSTRKDPSAFHENDISPINTTTRSENNLIQEEEVYESNLIFAPGIVYGFSFNLKKWGCFDVSGFSKVIFNKESFQELTMEHGMKSLLYELVRQYVSPKNDQVESSERVDPIAGKGEGLIVLCHGPPGTGKTLTAESIAENLERPLWALGIDELRSAKEDSLLRILDIATRWRVVLLLDEADIFLGSRSVWLNGEFLRHLEYYRGILFLTTNRIENFNEAFRSRVSLFLHYRKLGVADKAKIWKILLRRANAEGITDEFCEEMAGQKLNGREIRNAIHTAQVWANGKAEHLAVSHIKYIAEQSTSSLIYLKEKKRNKRKKDLQTVSHSIRDSR